jgi:hypothetical protein
VPLAASHPALRAANSAATTLRGVPKSMYSRGKALRAGSDRGEERGVAQRRGTGPRLCLVAHSCILRCQDQQPEDKHYSRSKHEKSYPSTEYEESAGNFELGRNGRQKLAAPRTSRHCRAVIRSLGAPDATLPPCWRNPTAKAWASIVRGPKPSNETTNDRIFCCISSFQSTVQLQILSARATELRCSASHKFHAIIVCIGLYFNIDFLAHSQTFSLRTFKILVNSLIASRSNIP